MSTIKTDRVDFEKLLNGLDPVSRQIDQPDSSSLPTTPSVIDNTSAAETMTQRAFLYNPAETRKGLRKKARKTILSIVKHIIPADIMDEDYVQDKMEQDIETLTGLYMQLENNTIMQQSLIESVSSGNTMPRMYEVFGQLTDKIQSINKQIVDTEQRLRKTYVDLKYEIRDKQGEDFSLGITGPKNDTQQIEQQGMVITSTKNLIAGARQKHIEKINSIAEAEFEVKED